MSDEHRIDSHKLVFHPGRVQDWLTGHLDWDKAKSLYPIYMEVSPVGGCNHRCVFCALDFAGYDASRQLDYAIIKRRLTEMASLGIRSIMFAGEGEPVLWRPLPEALEHCTSLGIDTSLTTNMVLFNDRNTDTFVKHCSWIKTSIAAGTPATYAALHGTKEADFHRVLDNMRRAVEIRNSKGYTCTLGAQMILLPENAGEAYTLGSLLKEIGMDYLVIKPYSQHKKSITRKYEDIDYSKYMDLGERLSVLNGGGFSVIFRERTMRKLSEDKRGYETCQATPFFWAYVMSDGSLWGCSAFLGDERFNYGDLHEKGFREIWEGDRRRQCMEMLREGRVDIAECRMNCRMDEVNRYLWQLTHPDRHVNFI